MSVGGTAASYAGQRKAAKAQANVLADYRRRNKAREDEANQEFWKSLNKSGRDSAEEGLQKGQDRRLDVYAGLDRALPSQPRSVAETTTNRTVAEPSGSTVKHAGSAWSKLLGRAQSRLGAYNDWQLEQGIKDNRTSQAIGRISDAARGDWNNVVPVQMTAAARKGDALQGWGSLLSAAGMLSGMSAALSAPASAGAAGAASPHTPGVLAGYDLGQAGLGQNIFGLLRPS